MKYVTYNYLNWHNSCPCRGNHKPSETCTCQVHCDGRSSRRKSVESCPTVGFRSRSYCHRSRKRLRSNRPSTGRWWFRFENYIFTVTLDRSNYYDLSYQYLKLEDTSMKCDWIINWTCSLSGTIGSGYGFYGVVNVLEWYHRRTERHRSYSPDANKFV